MTAISNLPNPLVGTSAPISTTTVPLSATTRDTFAAIRNAIPFNRTGCCKSLSDRTVVLLTATLLIATILAIYQAVIYYRARKEPLAVDLKTTILAFPEDASIKQTLALSASESFTDPFADKAKDKEHTELLMKNLVAADNIVNHPELLKTLSSSPQDDNETQRLTSMIAAMKSDLNLIRTEIASLTAPTEGTTPATLRSLCSKMAGLIRAIETEIVNKVKAQQEPKKD